jgi:hypothetical protein
VKALKLGGFLRGAGYADVMCQTRLASASDQVAAGRVFWTAQLKDHSEEEEKSKNISVLYSAEGNGLVWK